jgi:hypothetical protein
LVFFNLGSRFFLETENISRNEPSRERNSSDLSAKEELFSFENERVSVHLSVEISSELALSITSSVDVVSSEIGEEGPDARLRGSRNPVSVHIYALTALFLVFGLLSNFSSVSGSFGDIVIGLSSSDFTPETHVGSARLLGELSQ